jgi:hypothetical protein
VLLAPSFKTRKRNTFSKKKQGMIEILILIDLGTMGTERKVGFWRLLVSALAVFHRKKGLFSVWNGVLKNLESWWKRI